MKKWLVALLAAGSIAMLAGCRGSGEEVQPTQVPATETPVPTEAPARTPVSAKTDYLTEEDMQKASPWQVCDNSALAAVMKKAEAGEPVTIAVIGGSITQGTISSGAKDSQVKTKRCYADIFFDWWKETFPMSEVTVVNAGIGATDSYLGVHRVQEDVLDFRPDVVLVEYSVNDAGTNVYKNTYDNLVYKLLSMEDAPAVLLLFLGQANLSSAQSVHQLVGFQYGVPMVSYLNLLSDFYDAGRYTEKDLAGDVTHPSALGHAIIGEILWKHLNTVYAELDSYGEPAKFNKKIFTKAKYLNAELAGVGDITPESLGSFAENGKDFNGWGDVWKTTDGENGITFKITCRNLGILFWRSTSKDFGNFEVWVDGEHKATLQGEFPGGWGNYAHSQEVFASDTEAEHTITIKKADNSAGDDFVLLRLMISH